LAAVTARYLMVDPRSSQAAYAIPDHLTHADAAVERFERWARENLSNGFSLTDASRATGTSPRTLARRLRACWASRRYPIFRIWESNTQSIYFKRPEKASSESRGRSAIPMPSLCASCCAADSGAAHRNCAGYKTDLLSQ
jgi:lambda repressor-like predicted transcriptional regulator